MGANICVRVSVYMWCRLKGLGSIWGVFGGSASGFVKSPLVLGP